MSDEIEDEYEYLEDWEDEYEKDRLDPKDGVWWCRDEGCDIIELHPKHKLEKKPGNRKPWKLKSERKNKEQEQEDKEKRFKYLRVKYGSQVYDGTCKGCNGVGYFDGDPLDSCVDCFGTGKVTLIRKLWTYKDE